jgi:hypothetical protein
VAIERILTVDNSRKRGIIVMEWCFMCKNHGENVNHPFIHCAMAWELQPMLFFLLGVSWVMPHFVQEMFGCWMGRFGPELRGDLEICSFVSNVVSLEGKECSVL